MPFFTHLHKICFRSVLSNMLSKCCTLVVVTKHFNQIRIHEEINRLQDDHFSCQDFYRKLKKVKKNNNLYFYIKKSILNLIKRKSDILFLWYE